MNDQKEFKGLSGWTELLEYSSGWWRGSSDEQKKNSRGGTHQVGSEIHTRSVCREIGLETGEERKFFKKLGHIFFTE